MKNLLLTVMALMAVAMGPIVANAQNAQNAPQDTTKKWAVIKHVSFKAETPSMLEINALMSKADIPSYPLTVIPWPNLNPDYPPVKVSFKAVYTDRNLYMRYTIKEKTQKATFGQDEGSSPWTDDCLELFIMPNPANGVYYNVEMNCIGHGIMERGTGRPNRYRYLPSEITSIRRYSTLGSEPFGVRELPKGSKKFYRWSMIIVVPLELICGEEGVSLIKGKTVRAQVYKCGDNSPLSRDMSWSPLDLSKRDFHTPATFGYFHFE